MRAALGEASLGDAVTAGVGEGPPIEGACDRVNHRAPPTARTAAAAATAVAVRFMF
jgi:hypothetical protein